MQNKEYPITFFILLKPRKDDGYMCSICGAAGDVYISDNPGNSQTIAIPRIAVCFLFSIYF
ncbi:hypothetical protein D3Z47_01270 [Lachnospiraceae bacterium]|nr:hypothetical protein [Lachnospiraceae bacterium]